LIGYFLAFIFIPLALMEKTAWYYDLVACYLYLVTP